MFPWIPNSHIESYTSCSFCILYLLLYCCCGCGKKLVILWFMIFHRCKEKHSKWPIVKPPWRLLILNKVVWPTMNIWKVIQIIIFLHSFIYTWLWKVLSFPHNLENKYLPLPSQATLEWAGMSINLLYFPIYYSIPLFSVYNLSFSG